MPIPVKVHDNSSTVKVKPTNNTDAININYGCNTEGARLESLIKTETIERKEADEILRVTKQDKIYFIHLSTAQGILSEEMLNLLISSRLNKLVYQDNIYSLCLKQDNWWRYIGDTIDPNIKQTIVVNVANGEYAYSQIDNLLLLNHIEDDNRHLRTGEREFWNNKLNLTAQDELLEFNRN